MAEKQLEKHKASFNRLSQTNVIRNEQIHSGHLNGTDDGI
jgi:hypothetical protein